MSIKPIAVVIGDIHFTQNNLELTSKATIAAINKAVELKVPVILNGDTLDTKAIIRGEVANRLIKILIESKYDKIIINTGNHDLLSEKADASSLNFLRPYAYVVSSPITVLGLNIIPYQRSSEEFLNALNNFPKGSLVLGHQGTVGGQLGDYVKDSSAFDPKLTTDYKIFLNHYHKHYTLLNTVSVGSPLTHTFGEALDPPKGFLVLYDDYAFERIILNLRKHVIVEATADELTSGSIPLLNPQDLVWFKVRGTETELKKLKKRELGEKLLGHSNFKLDIIYTDSKPLETKTDTMTGEQILDALIETKGENVDELKRLWRNLA